MSLKISGMTPTSDPNPAAILPLAYSGANYGITLDNMMNSANLFSQLGTGSRPRSFGAKAREFVSVKDFGAIGDMVMHPLSEGYSTLAAAQAVYPFVTSLTQSVDWAAFTAAIASAENIFVPTGWYMLNQTLNMYRPVAMFGEAGSGSSNYNSFLSFLPGMVGIFCHNGWTTGSLTGVPTMLGAFDSSLAADGFVLGHLVIVREQGGPPLAANRDATNHGVWVKCKGYIHDCVISGFGGNGLHVVAAATDPSPYYRGNANLFSADRVSCTHNHHGFFIDGADANQCEFNISDGSLNRAIGIYDSSFLGNHWIAPHGAGNGINMYYVDNANACSTFIGAYTESGQNPNEFTARCKVLGGLDAAGQSSRSRSQFANIQGSQSSVNPNGTTISRITVTAGGAAYVTPPTVTVAAPVQVQATATATVNGGKVTLATMTNVGKGYTTTPNVTVTGDGSGATAAALMNQQGEVVAIIVNGFGQNYTFAGFTIDAPSGAVTATAESTIVGGVVTEVTITGIGAGYNYASPPAITFGGGGGGAGAAATASIFAGSAAVTNTFTPVDLFGQTIGDRMYSWGSNARQGSAAYGLFMHRGTDDMTMAFGTGSSGNSMLKWSGAKTRLNFGRSAPVPFVPHFSIGVWLGVGDAARNRTVWPSALPPASGEWARGDQADAISPAAGGIPGYVCTTGGTGGSTAVFKARAALAP